MSILRLRSLLSNLFNFFFPIPCGICGVPGVKIGICASCFNLVASNLITGSRCPRCSRPVDDGVELCSQCIESSSIYFFDDAYAPFLYAGVMKEIVRLYKFHMRHDLIPVFTHFLAPKLNPLVDEGYIVVPVPSGHKYNQMIPICRELSKSGMPVADILIKKRGPAQKKLSRIERIEGIKGRIRVMGAVPAKVALVDDIFTTGATAGECARVLKENGAQEVRVVAIALDP